MSWADKALKKHKTEKMVEQILNSKQYQQARKLSDDTAELKAFLIFCALGCKYMERVHRCKEQGLKRFLGYMDEAYAEMRGDDDVLLEQLDRLEEQYRINIKEMLNIEIVVEEE